jgi:hypothetical protein
MPTIREVYDPLVQAALSDNPQALSMLADVGVEIYKANPEKCKSADDFLAGLSFIAVFLFVCLI